MSNEASAKFVIAGKTYDIASAQKATLQDFYNLKVTTGIGMKTIQENLSRMGEEGTDLLEDPDLLKAFMALIWLVRRAAGEKLTFEEAVDFPLSEMQIVHAEAEEAPKALTGSEADASATE